MRTEYLANETDINALKEFLRGSCEGHEDREHGHYVDFGDGCGCYYKGFMVLLFNQIDEEDGEITTLVMSDIDKEKEKKVRKELERILLKH